MERPDRCRIFLVLSILVTTASADRQKSSESCNTQQDSSFLWRVSDREPPVHLFGTIHVPYTRVWDHIPPCAKQAFEMADSVFFELDLMDPETVAQLASCQMLPAGKRLSDVLPGDLYIRLKRHLEYVRTQMRRWMSGEQRGRGLYPEYLFKAMAGDWERKRPVWVMLLVNSLTEADVRSRGVPVLDLYLAREAARMRKRSGAVEKVQEQCLPLNGLNGSQVLFALNQTLHQQETLRMGEGEGQSTPYSTEDLIRHYNCGDLDSLVIGQDTAQVPNLLNRSSLPAEEVLLARNIDRYFRHEIIDKRNERMAQRVLHLIRRFPHESFFFAFGAGHFLGKKSVLEFLESGGHKVEQVDAAIKTHRRQQHHQRHRGEEPNELAGRGLGEGRRYRKRGHHHSGVHLLRSRPTPLPPPPHRKRQRHFNDLWVKMEDRIPGSSDDLTGSETTATRGGTGRNAKLWYESSTSGSALVHLSWACLSVTFLLLT